jgi:hypothetical protein
MNRRLLRILAPPAVIAVFLGALFGLSFLFRAAFALPLFGGPELFLLAAVVASVLVIATLAELLPVHFRPKRFVIGFAAPVAFIGCAVVSNGIRTGEASMPDFLTLSIVLLISVAAGLLVHFCTKSASTLPPNTSLERTREG